MKDLHADLYFGLSPMDGFGHNAVKVDIGLRSHARTESAFFVRRNAASDDHADTSARALDVEGGKPLCSAGCFFESGVHRTHDRPVPDPGKPKIEGGEQVLPGPPAGLVGG
jgi:hypothetical protein